MKQRFGTCKIILITVIMATFEQVTNAACTYDQFECDNGICTHYSNRCDLKQDCPNGEDEGGCDNVTCPDQLPYQCSSGKCIPQSSVCDLSFRQDCPGGEDQMNCSFQCNTKYHFRCDDTVCIYADQECDAVVNCPDGSDEARCECGKRKRACNNGACILKEKWCDQNADCPDHEDEENCPGERLCDEFRCDNGVCIFDTDICDKIDDCKNGEDEDESVCNPLRCFECNKWTNSKKRCTKRVETCSTTEQCAITYTLDEGEAVYRSGCATEDYCSNAHQGRGKCELNEQDECIFCCNEELCNRFQRRPKITIGGERV